MSSINIYSYRPWPISFRYEFGQTVEVNTNSLSRHLIDWEAHTITIHDGEIVHFHDPLSGVIEGTFLYDPYVIKQSANPTDFRTQYTLDGIHWHTRQGPLPTPRWVLRGTIAKPLRIRLSTISLPLFAPALLWYGLLLAHHYDRRRLTLAGHCPRCRYNLTDSVSPTCPECGTPRPIDANLSEPGSAALS